MKIKEFEYPIPDCTNSYDEYLKVTNLDLSTMNRIELNIELINLANSMKNEGVCNRQVLYPFIPELHIKFSQWADLRMQCIYKYIGGAA